MDRRGFLKAIAALSGGMLAAGRLVGETGPKLDGSTFPMGWKDDQDAVQRVLASLPKPLFSEAAPHLEGTGDGKTVLLWDYAKKVTGGHLPAQKQDLGTCVSRGWSRGLDYLQCVMIALGAPDEYDPISHAAVYGMAREIGHDLAPPGDDGAVGAWAAQAVSQWGTLRNSDCDDSDTSDKLAGQWGWHGVPAKYKQMALKHLAKTVSLVKSAPEARDAICNGFPVPVCSNQGFSMTRDANGFCKAQGRWSHCMIISAYRADKNWFCIDQSWGQNTPSGPTTLGQPDNSFWADWNVVDSMLRMGDSFAISAYDGFPAAKFHWFIRGGDRHEMLSRYDRAFA